jgi:phosphate starvation-inducible protein PhoH
MERISRSQKRQARQNNKKEEQKTKLHMKLKEIAPITKNQETIFRDFYNGKNLLIHGLPGTGKSFISLYLALHEIENYQSYNNITIIRSVVPSRDMGFLPGSIKEKSKIYELPYQAICAELYGRGDAYEILKGKGLIDFQTSSFLRGLTLDNTIIIVDECQNMTFQELSTIITRTGENARVIFCGDYRQTDLKYNDEKQGILQFMDILKKMNKYFTCIEFNEEDIVRSGLVKDFIIKKIQHDDYLNGKVIPFTNESVKQSYPHTKSFHTYA